MVLRMAGCFVAGSMIFERLSASLSRDDRRRSPQRHVHRDADTVCANCRPCGPRETHPCNCRAGEAAAAGFAGRVGIGHVEHLLVRPLGRRSIAGRRTGCWRAESLAPRHYSPCQVPRRSATAKGTERTPASVSVIPHLISLHRHPPSAGLRDNIASHRCFPASAKMSVRHA